MKAFEGAQRLPSGKIELCSKRGFLTPEECTALITRIDEQRRPSTLADHYGDADFRTSETCDLDGADPFVAGIAQRIAAFLGLDPARGEPLQGQRYAIGQQFKPHTDCFEPGGLGYAEYCGTAGQRTWTGMVYLNVPEAGGATRFKHLDKTFQPETGKIMAWNNLLPSGLPNPMTLHQGMPVRAGTKYLITAWFRQKPWG